MTFQEELAGIIELVNEQLDAYLPIENISQKNIIEAMRYSVKAGGKRLRPVLAMAVSRMLGGRDEDILPFGVAIEMIHTYSLIHDDLPCMDDDDLRRGKPTNHKVFGEATAVLAGDALLNRAFEVMIGASVKSSDKTNAIKTMDFIAGASSYHGMIGGQVIDMEYENNNVSISELKNLHSLKTGAIICASVLAPALLYGIEETRINSLLGYAQNLGLAFQIKDDILDVEGNEEILGKTVGSDNVNGKTTYISLYGIEKSKEILDELTNAAVSCLEVFGEKADFLRQLATYLLKRVN